MHTAFDPSSLLSALVSWSAQAFLLVAAGAIAVTTIRHPKARLLVWQGLLLALLLLPAIEPWKARIVELAPPVTASAAILPPTAAAATSSFHWRSEYWLFLIAAGAGLRLMWVIAGFLRLRRYRQQGTPLAGPPLRFASDTARWYASESVPGPVTYGWTRPVILLPSKVLELPADLREAIQCHELIHVRRGDWLFVLAETLVRSLLWFHPAIWFALSRIQLAREQAVDQEVVELLQNRERYLDALVAVAEYRLQPDLAPAPLFLRKRHLAARVEAVMKEIDMSRSRIFAGAAAVFSALALAACAAMWLFPFVSPLVSYAQTSPDSPGITVSAGVGLLHRAPVHAPENFVPGTVIVQATLNATGEVSDAQVVSGPQELRKEALASVLQWHYRPGASTAQISIQFEAPSARQFEAPVVQTVSPAPAANVVRLAPNVVAGGRGGRGGAATAVQSASSASFPAKLGSIQFQGVSPEAEQELRNRLTVREGDTVNEADIDTLRNTVQTFDGHLSASYSWRSVSGSPNELMVQVRVLPGAPAPPPSPLAAAPADSVLVASGTQSAKLVSKVDPVYPQIAKQARIQGTVMLQALIGKDGAMQNLKVVSSANPLLTPAAIDAVKQWVYLPTILNGQPVSVQTTINVDFSLQ